VCIILFSRSIFHVSAIAGIWRFDGKPDAVADCARMLAAQQMYGPHDGHHRTHGPIAMGRRLFRTLPEDIYDRQPLRSRDGRLMLVADVRLDNRDELTAELNITSSDALQRCDAEVLLACLEHWGERAIDRLVGDFAFALWDASTQSLLLVRDFLGHRPLHYHCGNGFFAFASMPKGLHALPDIPRAPDEQMIAEFLTLIPQAGPRTFFRHIARVEPAHIVTVTRDGVSSRLYWQPQRPRAGRVATAQYVEGLRHHLDQAVQACLRGANGIVGSHLSGGFDSGGVTATAARLLAPSGGKVVAFTAVPRHGYDGPDPKNRVGNEGPLAAATAAMYSNVEHVLIRGNAVSPLEGLDRHFFLNERPVLNTCNAMWADAINRAARERKLRIILNGQMGNMSLSYTGVELLPELLQAGRLAELYRVASQVVGRSGMRWRGVIRRTFGPFTPAWLWNWVNELYNGHKWDVLNYTAIHPGRLADLNLSAIARERYLDFSYRPRADGFAKRLWAMRRKDIGNVNKAILAGSGIDQRDPLADKRLIEYCLSIPTEHYFENGVQRALAKRTLADRLPPAVLREPRSGYQAVDWHEGLTETRSDIAAELECLTACAPAAKALDIARMKRLVENWPTSGWERDAVIEPYRLALLRGIAAGHFLRKALGANQ
jgi:asparagine synthase (glutamine-hydrolysing)